MSPFAELFHRFRKDERGVFLVIFAVLGLVLIATSGAVVDFSRVQQARTRAQTALDAAALALQSQVSDGAAADALKTQAQALLTERMNDSSITAEVDTADPDKATGKLTLTAHLVVPTYFAQLVGIKSIRSSLLSEVIQASSDLEVSVAADITGSMAGSKLTALKDALKTTISTLIKDKQPPDVATYTKMAIAPYSNGVNVGTYADNSRGALTAGKTITAITGMTGSVQTIKSITRANPAVVTTVDNHGLAVNDYIYISGVGGMTQVTDGLYRVGTVSGKTFVLRNSSNTNINSSSYSSYTANSGREQECANAACTITITASGHGFTNNQWVYGDASVPVQTAKSAQVSSKTTNTFVLLNSNPLNFAVNSKVHCTDYRCVYYRFANHAGGTSTWKATECAVERITATYASKDTAPMTDKVGIQYAPIDGIYQGHLTSTSWPYFTSNLDMAACPTAVIQPLTSTKKTLTDLVDTFAADGSTAGHIGFAWAWYMLSPNFLTTSGPLGTQWPSSSRPAAYKKDKLVKALILMTDGEFNTYYNSGVPALNSEIADDDNRSPGDGPNGNSLAQAKALCLEFNKSDYKILVYTIGFGITSGSAGDTMLKECASQPSMYKTASDSATLKAAFASIAKSLSELRVSK